MSRIGQRGLLCGSTRIVRNADLSRPARCVENQFKQEVAGYRPESESSERYENDTSSSMHFSRLIAYPSRTRATPGAMTKKSQMNKVPVPRSPRSQSAYQSVL